MDGSVGYPGYSGSLPNPMLASALTTTREATLAADATWQLHTAGPITPRPPFLNEGDIADWRPKPKVAGLQTSVRAALVELELVRGLQFTAGATEGRLTISGPGTTLITIHRPNEDVFDGQVKLVESFAALRAERMSEILAQVVPQTAHWSSVVGLSPERHRFTWELIGVGLRFVMLMCMEFKFAFDVQRAWLRSAAIQPMIITPGHAAFPSGHATEAYFVAELLPWLIGDPTHPAAQPVAPPMGGRPDGISRQLLRLAFRIAENRVVAGLHYPIDAIAGQALGCMVARYLVALSTDTLPKFDEAALTVGAVVFQGADRDTLKVIQPGFDRFIANQEHVTAPQVPFPAGRADAPVLRDLWLLAQREWVGVRP